MESTPVFDKPFVYADAVQILMTTSNNQLNDPVNHTNSDGHDGPQKRKDPKCPRCALFVPHFEKTACVGAFLG